MAEGKEFLGSEVPIIAGAMTWISDGAFVAARRPSWSESGEPVPSVPPVAPLAATRTISGPLRLLEGVGGSKK